RYPDLTFATRFPKEIPIRVDRERARFSAWYELFPRSASSEPGKHGTFADVERHLPEIAAMGFDILYLPPIHPIGRAFRKGPNNSVTSQEGDPGSPWAIGDASLAADPKKKSSFKEDDGGHKSIHPQLGAYADFDHLVAAAKDHGLEIALDIAFQCSPDHPWVQKHPEWFNIRPDGSIQYAENPPKKYQDIYPLNFESPDWRGLWDELYSVFEFWIKRGVKVFRVDNPHTKALPFWEWCLSKLQQEYADTIYLAEAFTRPHVMYSLAKAGYTQSYTYFTWRNTKEELTEYLEEITRPPISDFFKPNFWPNTPDILHKSLQDGGRPAFMQRLILAATMTANYGIYGPAYELGENTPAKPAAGKTESEEYMDSEKYQIRQRDRNAEGSLVPLITQINQIRSSNPALQQNDTLHFHRAENPQILCYSKTAAENTILVAINIDSVNEQGGWVHLDTAKLGLTDDAEYIVEDLLTGVRYPWRGAANYVALKPDTQPAHIFLVHKASAK
ncbi:MAG TPA: alpha-amylase family glycosyl hydrolase, partial [Acidobacteriaceae bacterium]